MGSTARFISTGTLLCAFPLLVACAEDASIVQLASTRAKVVTAESLRYEVQPLTSSLGGNTSVPTSIDQHGDPAGWSDRPDGRRGAVIWRDTVLDSLGTLGGPNSVVQWPGQSRSGIVVGIAEMDSSDARLENWSCSAFFPSVTHKVCRGFAWEGGVMTPMPTLGGTHSYAAGVNARGDVIGWAENLVEDPTCVAPQRLQFRAIVWSPRTGTVRELRPWPGDSTSAAVAINERGQVVGISGKCDDAVGKFSAQRMLLWEGDRVTELDHMGGEAWHTPTAINSRGEVVGFSNPADVADGTFLPRAFIWSRDKGTRELKRLAGDTFAQAMGINASGVVVGRSCGGPVGCRAVVWIDEEPIELKLLVPGGSPHRLLAARDINDDGVITGNLAHATSGKVHAFRATPVTP